MDERAKKYWRMRPGPDGLRYLYEDLGVPPALIGECYGVSRQAAERWLRSAGIPGRPKGAKRGPRPGASPGRRHLYELYVEEGQSIEDIAEALDALPRHVVLWLVRSHIPLNIPADVTISGRIQMPPEAELRQFRDKEHQTIGQICEYYGTSYITVRSWFQEYGLELGRREPPPPQHKVLERVKGEPPYWVVELAPCGLQVLIDVDDYPLIEPYPWLSEDKSLVTRVWKEEGGRRKYRQRLHRLLLGNPVGYVRHRNGDALDNRRCNLMFIRMMAETLTRMYWDDQMSIGNIARELEISVITALSWMRTLNIPTRSNSESQRLRWGRPSDDELWDAHWSEELTIEHMAAEYGVATVTIRKWLREAEVPLRTKNQTL